MTDASGDMKAARHPDATARRLIESGSGFRADEPGGAYDGSMKWQYYWWTDRDQRQFDLLWTPTADAVADGLADVYESAWPWLIARAIRVRAAEVSAAATRLASAIATSGRELPNFSTNIPAFTDTLVEWGAFQVVRRRRSWIPPHSCQCPVCHREFGTGELPWWTFPQFGPPRYCLRCCEAVRNGSPGPQWTERTVVAAVRGLSAALDAIPPQDFARLVIPIDIDPKRRDGIVAAAQKMPPAAVVKEILGVASWLGVLQRAGVVGDAWRPSMGTRCIAQDGHLCLSLLEKSIDDWFSRHGIQHEKEPHWPQHPTLNPNGSKRADWRLSDGTFVECAGLLSDKAYAQKIEGKRRLASDSSIALIVLTPADVSHLNECFTSFLSGT